MNATDADVAVVGAGPVGQLLAALLGQRGHRVLVLERWPSAYPLPRAVVYDDEVARIFFAAGVGNGVRECTQVADTYEWRNGDGETLLRFDWSAPGESGHPRSNMFCQPELEAVLADRLRELPTVRVARGQEVVDIACDSGGVELVTRNTTVTSDADGRRIVHADDGNRRRWRATYVVGADGAESFVRSRMRTDIEDLGFFYDWLIVDVVMREERRFHPVNLQICDPARPVTQVSGGPGRRRWEFMLLPGETKAELNTLDAAWRLLGPFDVHPGNADLERHTVYTFQARWVRDWRDGRLLLAGDAAHLMPPFFGQGMCSGIRDAANLAWKLDLVLTGRCGETLLDTYTPERSAHVQHAVYTSVALGRVICVLDPEEARLRDAPMIAVGGDPSRAVPPAPPPVLGEGVLGTGPAAGHVTGQGRVRLGGRTGLFDDVVGTGFVVAATVPPSQVLRPDQLAFLADIGTHLVHVVPAGTPDGEPQPGTVVDVDGYYLPRWAAQGWQAIVVRPDTYLFDAAAEPEDLPAVIDVLRDRLGVRSPAAPRP